MAFPEELKQLKRFVVWRGDKRPCSAVTGSPQGWQKPENWASYADALRVFKEKGFEGIGFVFSFPYVGIDLDDCIEEDGLMNSFAREITNKVDTFTEYSKSGKGLHLYCKVTEPVKALKTDVIEIYSEGRFFITTEAELDDGQMNVTEQTENIKELIAAHTAPRKPADNTPAMRFCEKNRNIRMASEVGRMFNYWDKETVRVMAHTLNESICLPPLDDAEMETIIDSISKREIKHVPPRAMQQQGWEQVEGKRDLDKTPYKGISRRPGRYIATGIDSIDYAINDLAPGCVTLITGRMNGGKSVFVKQIIANAISGGNKILSIAGEGDQELSINALYECAIGRDRRFFDIIKINKRFHKEPKDYVLDALKKWHEGKLTLFNKGQAKFKTTADLFEMLNHEVKESHFDLVIIDNLMSILTAKATEKNEAQADFMQHCHDLADLYKIHIILVLHPNKEYRKGEELEVEHISGTSDLYNKADNIIAVAREYKEEKTAAGINGRMTLLKNRYYPDLIQCETHFDRETGLLLEITDGKPVLYEFNWTKYLDPDKTPMEVITTADWFDEEAIPF